jgi:alkyl sulfatase BDS1-like metallo-beta-lactamase superfamily hydrolase
MPSASETTKAFHEQVLKTLPFRDTQDFDDAERGFIATISAGVITDADGRTVWDLDSYAFAGVEAAPETVNPSLWRQFRLLMRHGLYEVVPGIYQVRSFDLSNVTFVEGDEGVIVIDPLISAETAAAALALYRERRGDRPVTAVIYTHSHADHFGGVKGIVDEADVAAGRVPILAPQGFLEHAVSENIFAGAAMTRRAAYMYGALLPRSPEGQVSAGLGLTTSVGQVTLIAPTLEIAHTGQTEVLDGVPAEFQLTPGTEAPAEMNFLFPTYAALCGAENVTHNLHNVVTLRGALVRDARMWSNYLNEAIMLFGARTDVLFASHHWPRWGRERAIALLEKQRDLYGYLHDQTLRLLNKGYVGAEIAEMIELPPGLGDEWANRGYYGSVSHNVKAIYQRYMGWFDGNPAHLWQHPPEAAATRYVEFMGGADAVLGRARRAFEEGDYRWVAEVVSHVVFADPSNVEARELEARALEQLGYQAENGTWRSFFLMGALELREGGKGTPVSAMSLDVLGALSLEQLLAGIAIRVDGPRAAAAGRLVLNWVVDDERAVTTLNDGYLSVVLDQTDETAAATLTASRSGLIGALLNGDPSGIAIDGDASAPARLLALLDDPDPDFEIVLP